MDTCFLFAKDLDDTGCVFLKLSADGQTVVAPKYHSFEEIRILQKGSSTIVVENSENTSILSLELSWLPERKARVAIPYALEEQLAQPIEELHFAFDKLRYQDRHYLVTVISKERIKHLMQILQEQQIDYKLISTDWFALSPQEMVISGSTLLIHQTDFKGALSQDLAISYLSKHPFNPPLQFTDSEIPLETESTAKDLHSYIWIAQALLRSYPLNLCQGTMEHGKETAWVKKGYYWTGALCAIWLLSIIIVKSLILFSLNKQTATVDEQIARIYHQFFPNAKQVISPKFRMEQVLKGTGSNKEARFWFLLNQLAKSLKGQALSIEQFRYQNQSLGVTLVSTDFAALEHLKNQLKTSGLKVKQTQASTRDQQVVAILELT